MPTKDCAEEWKQMVAGANDFEQDGVPDPLKLANRDVDPCAEAYMVGFEARKQQEENNA